MTTSSKNPVTITIRKYGEQAVVEISNHYSFGRCFYTEGGKRRRDREYIVNARNLARFENWISQHHNANGRTYFAAPQYAWLDNPGCAVMAV